MRRLRRLPGGSPCLRIPAWRYHLGGELKPVSVPCRCAHRDLERQLDQAAPAAAAAVAGRAAAGRRLPAGDQARRRQARRAARRRARGGAGTPSRHTARRRGTAWRSSRASGWTTWSRACRAAPGFPHQEARAVAATCAGVRVVSVYVPNGRTPGVGALRVQARVAGGAARRGRRRAGRDGRLRRHERRADRRGRLRSRRLHGQTHVTPPERAALAALEEARAARRRARALAGRAGLHLLGLPGRDVPPGLRDADRPRAGGRGGRRARPRRLGRPAGAQGQGAERSRAGDRRPGRGAGR